jgi:hypothetical protein
MRNRPKEERLMTSYLLGQASELEQMLLETAYFRDAKYFELILAMEDELISNYVTGLMSSCERRQFREHFLKSARRRQRYEALSKLIECVAQYPALPENFSVEKPPAIRHMLKKHRTARPQRWL